LRNIRLPTVRGLPAADWPYEMKFISATNWLGFDLCVKPAQ
jgi:hypothetical protein